MEVLTLGCVLPLSRLSLLDCGLYKRDKEALELKPTANTSPSDWMYRPITSTKVPPRGHHVSPPIVCYVQQRTVCGNVGSAIHGCKSRQMAKAFRPVLVGGLFFLFLFLF